MPESAADFHFFGTAEDFLDLIITNLNRVYGAGAWTKGTCKSTNAKKLFSSGENCLTMIGRLAKEFDGEFYVSGDDDRTINFVDSQGSDTGITLQYQSGIFDIERRTVDPENLITRLYAYGGERNIPSDYRSRAGRLMFEYLGNNYVESGTSTYGIIEATKIFDDIYPHRDGTITSVHGSDTSIFYDSGIDFNINDYLLPGIAAKVHFKTGNLAGYEFEISAYDNSTKEITLVQFIDGDGIALPDATLKPAVGDEYVILDIKMPTSYVTAAEDELLTKAQAYLSDSNAPKVEYVINVDNHYLKTNSLTFDIGDSVTVVDTDLAINETFRIVELEQSVCYPYMYKFRLAKTIRAPELIERVYDAKILAERETRLREKNYITSFQLMNKIFMVDDEIALRVGDDDNTKAQIVVNAINGGTVLIDAKNVQISGYTTFTSGYDPTTKVASLGGTYASAVSNPRLCIFPDANTGIQLINSTGADVFKALVGGTNSGDVIIGKFSSNAGMMWDDSENTFEIRGKIVITSGSGISMLTDAGGLATKDSVNLDSEEVTNKSLANLDSTANNKLSGIEDNATKGATWGTNLANIPGMLCSPSGAGLYLSSTNLGYYDGGDWKTYMDNSGNFYLGGTSGKFQWVASTDTLTISGGGLGGWTISPTKISITGIDIDAGNSRIKLYTGDNYVQMSPSGLIGYSASLEMNTFVIPTDGSAPTFSSGTIKEVTYEMYTSGVIRTNANPAANGGMLINNTSMTGYNTSGAKRFQVVYSGTDQGDVYIGAHIDGKGIFWDQSAGTFSLKCVTGVLAGFTINATTITSTNVTIDSGNNLIKVAGTNVNFTAQVSSSQGVGGLYDSGGYLALLHSSNDASYRWGILTVIKNLISPAAQTTNWVEINASSTDITFSRSGAPSPSYAYLRLEDSYLSLYAPGDTRISPAGVLDVYCGSSQRLQIGSMIKFYANAEAQDGAGIAVTTGDKIWLDGAGGKIYTMGTISGSNYYYGIYANDTCMLEAEHRTGVISVIRINAESLIIPVAANPITTNGGLCVTADGKLKYRSNGTTYTLQGT